MKRSFKEFLQRKENEYKNFNDSDLNRDFIHAFESGKRVEVCFVGSDGQIYETKRGTLGITTGWKPCFLLMLTKRSISSSYTIGKKDFIKSYIN